MATHLLVIDGADQGRFFPLSDGLVTLGSSRRNADICLHDLYVRRIHCELEVEGNHIMVREGEDHGGTFVNGQQITQCQLRPGDVLRIGNTHLRLDLGERADETEVDEVEEVEEAAPRPIEAGKLPRLPRERLPELTDHMMSHYEVGALLGQGQTGAVFRARDQKNGHTVALKVLSQEFPQNSQEMQRFAQAMKTVLPLRHKHLANLYNAGKSGPYCWLALDYVEGESLSQVLERIGQGVKLNWKHGLRLAIHLGRALEFIHRNHLVHGNITPQNILIGHSDKVVKLGDLMLAQALEGSALQAQVAEAKLLAELPYMSPEQTDPAAYVDSLSDIYSLGAVVYARLTGRPPFHGDTPEETIAQIHEGKLVRPRKVQGDIPDALERVVMNMLARQQENRSADLGELLKVLEQIAEQEEVPV
jgi:serine/threonine protein kinase